MTEQYIPHPAKNFTPRRNAPKPQLEAQGRVQKPVDITDKDSLRTMAMTELAGIVQRNAGDVKGIAAVRELLDRLDGKPMQMQQSLIAVADAGGNNRQLSADEIENMLITAQIMGMRSE